MTVTPTSLTHDQKLAQLKTFFESTPPLGKLLSTQRSRRVAKGYSIDSGKPETRASSGNTIRQERSPLEFQSEHEVMPLTDVEEAILAWSACGANGLACWDIAVHGGFHELSWIAGRTGATPGNAHSTDLMIIKDEGVFIYKPDQEREKIVEIEGEGDYEKVLRWHDQYMTQVLDHRPNFDYGTRVPGCPNATLAGPYQFNLNREGTTWFLPLSDMGYLYFSILLNLFDVWHIAIVDDQTGEPAGVGAWMGEGKLEFPITISQVEMFMFQEEQYPTGLQVANMRLAAESMGLGSWIFGGYFDDVLMGAFPQVTPGVGFQHSEPNPKAPLVTGALKTFGVAGVKEGTYVPSPRYNNGTEIIDQALADKYSKGMTLSPGDDNYMVNRGPFAPDVARAITDDPACQVSDWAREASIAYVDYVVDRYGQCPAYVNPLQCNFSTVVHHVDEAFYEKFYGGVTNTPQIRNHMAHWH
ncbi:MAG: hypothetical protein ACRDY7_11635 [Acidimicrobiia bacterium]